MTTKITKLTNVNILVVENDPNHGKQIQDELTLHEANVEWRNSIDAAVGYLRTCHTPPDIVVLDLDFQGIHTTDDPRAYEGLKLLQYYQILGPQTRVIVFSKYNDYVTCRESFLHGASNYVVKRIDFSSPEKSEEGVLNGECLDELVVNCVRVREYLDSPSSSSLTQWIHDHFDELNKRWPNKAIAVFHFARPLTETAGLETYDNHALLIGNTIKALEDVITQHKELWRDFPEFVLL